MNPTTGIADCCARAVSDHATTVLLKSLMNSRRLMGFTPLAENHLRKSLIRSSSESYVPHCIRVGRPMSALGQKHLPTFGRCPLYPQKRTHALQQTTGGLGQML
jgi:hypothetical protein